MSTSSYRDLPMGSRHNVYYASVLIWWEGAKSLEAGTQSHASSFRRAAMLWLCMSGGGWQGSPGCC